MATIEGHQRVPPELVPDFEAAARALPADWHVKLTLDTKAPFLLQVGVEGAVPKRYRTFGDGHFEAVLRFLEELRRERSNS